MDTGVDIEKVREFLGEKELQRKERLLAKWKAAKEDFRAITEHLISVYNPARVYQWGSLLDFDCFSEISDIDIAVEGFTGPEEYFAFLGDAMNMTAFPLDIIELEKVDSDTAGQIKKRGKLIYEREP